MLKFTKWLSNAYKMTGIAFLSIISYTWANQNFGIRKKPVKLFHFRYKFTFRLTCNVSAYCWAQQNVIIANKV